MAGKQLPTQYQRISPKLMAGISDAVSIESGKASVGDYVYLWWEEQETWILAAIAPDDIRKRHGWIGPGRKEGGKRG